jgi:hypothetical protein
MGHYSPPNGRIVELLRASSLIWENVRIEAGIQLGVQTFYLGGSNPENGSLFVRGGSWLQISDPFYTEQTPGVYRISIQNVGRRGSSIHYDDSYFTNK